MAVSPEAFYAGAFPLNEIFITVIPIEKARETYGLRAGTGRGGVTRMTVKL